jgi:hypothetical protein
MQTAIFDLRGFIHDQVHDIAQNSDQIGSGSVLLVDGGIAVMVGAYPFMVVGCSDFLTDMDDLEEEEKLFIFDDDKIVAGIRLAQTRSVSELAVSAYTF